MKHVLSLLRYALLLAGMLLAACSQARVQTIAVGAAGGLPPPTRVVVEDFTDAPGEVRLDSGIGPRLLRQMDATPVDTTEMMVAQRAQSALGETLAKRLAGYGLPVERLPAGAAAPPGSLLVQGQIVSVDEGNRTRRLLIGLGAGASRAEVASQLYWMPGGGQPRFVRSFSASADSGRMPGAAETMGAGAAAQHLASSAAVTAATHTGAEMRRTDEEALADKLAEGLARQIGEFAVSQGWISAGALR